MDFRELIELERKPFKERVELQYGTYLKEVEKGFMIGREGAGPVDVRMQYKNLHDDNFRDVLVFGSNSYLGLANHPYVKNKVIEAVEKYGIGTGDDVTLTSTPFGQGIHMRLTHCTGATEAGTAGWHKRQLVVINR